MIELKMETQNLLKNEGQSLPKKVEAKASPKMEA
jgi:hypothetical protein